MIQLLLETLELGQHIFLGYQSVGLTTCRNPNSGLLPNLRQQRDPPSSIRLYLNRGMYIPEYEEISLAVS